MLRAIKKHIRQGLLLALLLVVSGEIQAQFYYGTMQDFGKNRIQYNEFNWTFYRFERFDVYFYTGGRPVAQKVAYMMERQIRFMERTLETTLEDRIQVLVFNSLTDLKQSNLNVEDESVDMSSSGIIRTVGSKMFVFFDGDFIHLEQQVKLGLAELALLNLIYGGFVNNLRNKAFLSLPDWYLEGLISWLSTPWNPEIDQWVQDGFRTNKYKRLNSLTGLEAKYAGHAMWHYLAQTYGPGVIKNILFLTLINRSVSSGFEYVLGQDLKEVQRSWTNFYTLRYKNALEMEPMLGKRLVRAKRDETVSKLAVSRNGQFLSYQTNRLGQYSVYYKDFEKNRRRRVLKKGHRIDQNNDLSYPLLAWHPNGRILAVIIEDKGFIWLYYHDVEKRKTEKRKLFGFEKVLDFSYSSDGKEFLMSAVKNGRNDIFVYTIVSTSIERITDDDFTDRYPAFINNDQQIVFSSNRPHDTLKINESSFYFDHTKNLFVYDRRKPKDGQMLWRLTQDMDAQAVMPQAYDQGMVSFLSTAANNVQNQYLVTIDSFIAYVDTIVHYDYQFNKYHVDPLNYNVAQQVFDKQNDQSFELVFRKGRYEIYQRPRFDPQALSGMDQFRQRTQGGVAKGPEKGVLKAGPSRGKPVDFRSSFEVDIENYQFHPDALKELDENAPAGSSQSISRLITAATARSEQTSPQTSAERKEISFPSVRNYALTFFRDELDVQISNIFANPQYQPFTGRPNGQLLNPGFNGYLTVGAADLMNDYRLVLGLRTDFQPVAGLSLSPNSEILVAINNDRKRLNQGYSFYRRSQLSFEEVFFRTRFLSHQANYILTWPFNEVTAIRGTFGYRNDRLIPLSDQPLAVLGEVTTTDFGISKAELIYDNTIKRGLNLMHGTRYKIFAEYYHNFSNTNGGLWTAGLDYRKYTRVHGSIIWANRAAYGTSFGPEKLIYFMGGVDNQFRPNFNEETPIALNENYIFQTLATNMRGFFQNARNGNNFAVINSELRIPLFRYLYNRPLRDFFANFQVVPFVDIGTAWNGPSPYSPENAINNEIITGGPGSSLTIILNRQRDPIIIGSGVGLRSRILGYFVRADWAWGIEDGIILPRVFYLSIGTDF
jgi:hypothetical protein